MRLRHHQRRLAAHMALNEVVVVGVKPGSDCRISEPVADGLRDTDIRPERPAVGADIDEMRRVVVAGRGYDDKARASCRRRRPLREFLLRERGVTDKIISEPKPDIAQPRAKDSLPLSEDLPPDLS